MPLPRGAIAALAARVAGRILTAKHTGVAGLPAPIGTEMESLMTSQQGSLDLLHDPVAQDLLASTVPARLAYTWHDGKPRIVPIGFHWNGTGRRSCSARFRTPRR